MTRVGYARVSTRDQTLDAQVDMLKAAGVDKLYIEQASGTLAKRPQLDAMLDYVRAGDVVVITKLDRLGRSVKNLADIAAWLSQNEIGLQVITQGIDTTTLAGKLLFNILAALAEFEHDLIVERTREGLAAARARGRNGGRPQKMTPAKIEQARRMYDGKELPVTEIAEVLGVSRRTLYRYLEPQSS